MVKYLDIYETFKSRIDKGYYKLDEKLPDGTSLAKEFKCSELTIKKALDILVKDGLVVRKRGSGSYIKRPLSQKKWPHLYGTKANADLQGQKLDTFIINYSVEPADKHLATRLNCEEGEMLYHVIRVRHLDNEPYAIEDTYMPIDVITGLKRQHIQASIYEYITKTLGLKIHSSMMEITVRNSNEEEAKHLHLNIGDKLVNVEQVAYLDNGEIFEYSNSKHVCEKYRFSTNFVKM
ncbi:GntR family transcriptional regulator [Vibrio sp. TH_r3]|uniref:GntR family transcriptional regulator n=1 Tax=Vibrio sp. TH_r3 TaxID=3082084 RepID=UPI002955D9FF|nr:GntR family transcriptional regulator [Vibrio sp. TH_r3]MDV7105085.1 GntR family transcriptional regulator [Vibrio sp. TH_r3]